MKPILFNTEMVRAVLDGRKTQTRRVVKPQPNDTFDRYYEAFNKDGEWILLTAPFRPGDILYVRETWALILPSDSPARYVYKATDRYSFGLDGYIVKFRWHPSIHMPKEAARLFLRVTDVRAERLQEITDDGLDKEGVIPSLVLCGEHPSPNAIRAGKRKAFCDLWDNTIKPADRERYGWDANPWVWVICFERCEKPEEDEA